MACPILLKSTYLFFNLNLYIYIFNIILLIIYTFFNNFLKKKYFLNFFILNFFILFLVTSILFYFILKNNLFFLVKSNNLYFFKVNIFLNLSLKLDLVSFLFIYLTMFIGFFSLMYSFIYMKSDPFLEKFSLLLISFIYSMIFLLISNNLFCLLLGWELIGVFSYFLINFWCYRSYTFKSSFKAFCFNKLSDVNILIFIILMFNVTSSLDMDVINLFNFNNYIIYLFSLKINILEFILLFLTISCFCKSAQFGFNFWLPDSMEAPVPASSLIHSATLVSAGIYLFLKFKYLFLQTIFLKNFIIINSCITIIHGGLVSIYQHDLKKILAYSTINNCGFLILICFISDEFSLVLFLYNHGLFKALSFFCVGNIILNNNHIQSFKRMGGFFKNLPFEFFLLSFSLFNLCNYPFSIGYFIKHNLIIDSLKFNKLTTITIILGSLTSYVYSFNLLKNIFFTNYKSHYKFYKKIYLNNFFIILCLLYSILAILTIYYIYCNLLQLNYLNIKNNFLYKYINMFNYFFIFILFSSFFKNTYNYIPLYLFIYLNLVL